MAIQLPPAKRYARDRSEWAAWMEKYGAANFFDHFMRNAQGALSQCVFCREQIVLDIREGGGVADWKTPDGDYGCNRNPESNEEGTAGHFPQRHEGSI